jgi:hypothetical protein
MLLENFYIIHFEHRSRIQIPRYLQFDTHSIFPFPYLIFCLISLPALLKIRILVLLVLSVRHQSLHYVLSISSFTCKPLADVDSNQGRIQDFKLRGAHLKKIAPSGGRRENFWGISCEKSRFYAKKIIFFQF